MVIKYIKGILEIKEQVTQVKLSPFQGQFTHPYRLTVYKGSSPRVNTQPSLMKTGSTKSVFQMEMYRVL